MSSEHFREVCREKIAAAYPDLVFCGGYVADSYVEMIIATRRGGFAKH